MLIEKSEYSAFKEPQCFSVVVEFGFCEMKFFWSFTRFIFDISEILKFSVNIPMLIKAKARRTILIDYFKLETIQYNDKL